MRDRLVVLAFTAGWAGVRLLPERAAYALFAGVGEVAFRARLPGVRRLRANLARAVPDATERQLDRLTRRAMHSYLRYWCDTFRMPAWDRARLLEGIEVEHEHRLRDAYATGRGVVAALSHSGNWDHAGAWASATGMPVTTVAERLRPEALFDRFVRYREGLGMTVLPLTGGEGNVSLMLRTSLRAGTLVCLVADRDLRGNGMEVELLGERARVPAGPAVLAMASGAALIPLTMRYAGRRMVLTIHEPVDIPTVGTSRERAGVACQAVADAFSSAVRTHPEHWHMMQPVFVSDLPPLADASTVPDASRAPR